jgi:hypothetical protein
MTNRPTLSMVLAIAALLPGCATSDSDLLAGDSASQASADVSGHEAAADEDAERFRNWPPRLRRLYRRLLALGLIPAETCDGADNDWDGLIDEGYPDTDRDGTRDCVDAETCDGLDNDGDGRADEDFGDADYDGTPDCLDTETCDGFDNDGDGQSDEGFPDADGDGIGDCADTETCDGIDNNGDGQADEGFDADGDGFSDCQEECQVQTTICSEADGEDTLPDGSSAVEAWSAHPNWTASIPGATWIWSSYLVQNPQANETVTITREVLLQANATNISAVLQIASDNTYSVTANGAPMAFDYGGENFWSADTWDLGGPIHGGSNTLVFTMQNNADPGGSAFTNPAGLLYCVDLEYTYDKGVEICDGVDNDCDGLADEGLADTDGDGDCDALDDETCDGIDNDGDGQIDESFTDNDGDGIANCTDTEDCDSLDNDGDGEIDEGYADADHDGTADCVDEETCDGLDNDGNGWTDEIFPDTDADGTADCIDVEECDARDNDGDGATDEDFADTDGDGTADCVDAETCDTFDNDGDGLNNENFPDTDADGTADCIDAETCDGLDNDGDGATDEFFADTDGDGVADCVDIETCDGLDNNGNGATDEGFGDNDADGLANCVDTETCDTIDNNGDGRNNEGFADTDADGTADCLDTEDCDGLDNDGDGQTDEDWGDSDGDGTADCRDTETCDGLDNDGDLEIDENYADSDNDGTADCVDTETCDGVDNDGDASIDEGFDADRDGFADCMEDCAATLKVCSTNDGKTLIADGRPATPSWAGNSRWTASIPGASWLWDQTYETNPWNNNIRTFFRGFDLQSTASGISASLSIAADNSYDVQINGQWAASDSSETNYFAPADVWNVSSTIAAGHNEAAFTVNNWAQPGGVDTSNPGGLLYCLDVNYTYEKDPELCDGLDNDCDNQIDEGFSDNDSDGIANCVDQETCDGRDNDGDGQTDEGFRTGPIYYWSMSGGGNNGAGVIEYTATSYNTVTRELSWTTTIRHNAGSRAKGFWVALNNGPNPKGRGELALFYFDASKASPILTVYAYNGENGATSFYDGSTAGGVQAPDRIASSLRDDAFVKTLTAVDDGTRITMSFTIDASVINTRTPLYVAPWAWTGASIGTRAGTWYHPVSGLSTAYDANGWLTAWNIGAQGYIDTDNLPTTSSSVCAVPR